jgi:hypothetical protein
MVVNFVEFIVVAKKKEIKHRPVVRGYPVVLLVEGADYLHFITPQLEKNNFDKCWIYDFSALEVSKGGSGQNHKLDKELEFLFDQTEEFQDTKVIGIIRDIERAEEGSLSTARENMQASLDKIILKYPKLPIKTLIMPHDKQEGCLENALIAALVDPRLLKCANAHLACVGISEPNPNHLAKKQVHAIIGASEGAKTLGETSLSGLWDWDHLSLKAMLDFISQLQEQHS